MPARPLRAVISATISATVSIVVVAGGLVAAAPAAGATSDLARHSTISASASQNDQDGNFPASNAIDGSDTTRWASGNGPDSDTTYEASITSDLGASADLTGLTITWEASYAVSYDVEVAASDPDTESSWSVATSITDGDGQTDEVTLPGGTTGRYVRLHLLQRAAATWEAPKLHYYGYSIYTLQVHGSFATPLVNLAAGALEVNAGSDAVIGLELTNPAATDQSVHIASSDGTAVAGTDYTAVDEDVTFAAGETQKSVTIPTLETSALSSTKTFTLALTAPSAGIALGSATGTTVTVKRVADLPNDGTTTVFHDFESGVPTDYSTWASADALKPVLATATDATVPDAADGNHVLTATVSGTPDDGSYFGFTNDTAKTDWSASDGFSFFFLGHGTGKTLSYELKNGDKAMFDQNVVDSTDGWRKVSVLFSDLRLKGKHSDPARFDASASTGFAVTLTGLGAGSYSFDDFALFERAYTLQNFEGDVPLSDSAHPTGFFTWGSTDNLVTMGVHAQTRPGAADDNMVLSGDYLIPSGAYGGFSDNLATSQDWSSFRGIRFWWYASQASNPASPTAGDDIKVEIKDGGPDGEHSELWAATFKDNWGSSSSRWKLVELPFSKFTLGSYQPGDSATKNGTLDLTSANGFAITMAPGAPTSRTWAIDDAQLYGTPAVATTASVATSQDVYLIDQGESATVSVVVSTPKGDPLDAPVTVNYAAGDGTAAVDTNFEPFSGTLTFDAGTASGDSKQFTVTSKTVTGGDEARIIPVTLTVTGAQEPTLPTRVVINAHGLPYLDSSLPAADRVADLLDRMTQDEKVGQMTQAERLGLSSPSQISELGLGSILSGGGSTPAANTPAAWADMIDGFQREALATSLQVPLLYGADAVHGHSNVLDATIFPHNIGLGATRDPALVEKTAQVTAEETKSTGVNWAFAPCLCVSRDERWGRTYESFGEDPALVASFAAQSIEGLQGSDPTDKSGAEKLLATAKHWAGDGGTTYDASKAGSGYPIDQGLTHVASEADFERLFVAPYLPALAAGVGSIMPSYSGVSIADGPDVRMHENTALNTTLLKQKLGFSGFLISDWEGIDKLPGGTYADKVARSVNSGLDMAMAPYNFADFIASVKTGVTDDVISQDRVNDAVSRILTQKFDLGLFDDAMTDRSKQPDFGSTAHRTVARDAAAESQVLLKNDGVLPLTKNESIYLAGSNADDLGNQAGGWTISWQGGSGATTQGTTIREGIEQVAPGADVTYSKTASEPLAGHDVGVVVVGETPYAEGQGDVGNNGHSLSLSSTDRDTIDRVCAAMKCVVLVVAGRTQLVTDKLAAINGLVASFLPGTEGEGVADVLFGDKPFTGRLPLSWPKSADQVPINVGDTDYDPLFAYGWGERTDAPLDRLKTVAKSATGAALAAVNELIAADVWASNGQLTDAASAMPLVKKAASALEGTGATTLANADLVTSIARDAAQAAVVAGTAPAGSSATTADAEHALLSGKAGTAVEKLATVAGLSTTAPDPGTKAVAGVTPKITGTLAVGQTLTAVAGAWKPADVTLSYRWLRAGTPIAGATSSSYLLTPNDAARSIAVAVTGSKTGYTSATEVSAASTPVAAGAFVTVKPTISGTAAVGSKLKAITGTWKPAARFTYRWLNDGKSIAGATGSTYTVKRGDAGDDIRVRVTGTRSGYATESVTSATLRIGKTLQTHAVRIAGTAKVGHTVTAVAGNWGPGSVKLSYRWKRNGSAIAGHDASTKSYTLVKADRGTRITVTVTGSKNGYAPASRTSGSVRVR